MLSGITTPYSRALPHARYMRGGGGGGGGAVARGGSGENLRVLHITHVGKWGITIRDK